MFSKVIIDITAHELDRPFTYKIPDDLVPFVKPGVQVNVPFGKGNTIRKGYVIEVTEFSEYPVERIKEIDSLVKKAVTLEEQLISLAIWMRERYGGTLSQCLSVCLPNKTKVEAKKERFFVFQGSREDLERELKLAEHKKYYARVRLLQAFSENSILPASIVIDRLNITNTSLKPLIEKNIISVETEEKAQVDEKIISAVNKRKGNQKIILNDGQRNCKNGILNETHTVSLIHGITGSGKTEVYLELIEEMIKEGKETIVLIPEIALTYQTVMRFYERFGALVSMVHSRVSKGDKCERFQKALDGEIKVMIGPRSALFTPFKNLGLIIIDEEHEPSYFSEQVPRYSAVETAITRAKACNAKVVLGSATPSVESYYRAKTGDYALYMLTERGNKNAVLPDVTVVDMREELKQRNRSVFSRALREKIEDRLKKNEQVMLFLNRRGYSGAVSCRTCGEPITCPHCSVTLNYHKDHTLRCHICNYQMPMVKFCPKCNSNMIGTFGIGTEKIEELVLSEFPGVRTLRMDADTTSGKDGHEQILEKFMNHEADILIGTQMIVKGHDFKDVTLVGILAADLSMNVPDYTSAERTFQLLTQAEGRAGRSEKKGECIVQTYMPEHYAVSASAKHDYLSFYQTEMLFRKAMKYPPMGAFMKMIVSGAYETEVKNVIDRISRRILNEIGNRDVRILGPVEAGLYKVKDMYRMILNIKTGDIDTVIYVKKKLEDISKEEISGTKIFVSFE